MQNEPENTEEVEIEEQPEPEAFVAKVIITSPGNMPVGDREKVAEFLRYQALAIMNHNKDMNGIHEAVVVDTGDGFVRR